MNDWTIARSGEAVERGAMATWAPSEFSTKVAAMRHAGGRLSQLFARPVGAVGEKRWRIYAVVAMDAESSLRIGAAEVGGDHPSYPSITPAWPAAQAFEREIFELHGIEPVGHPWLKPLRRPPGTEAPGTAGYPFYALSGEQVHEVAVGPVHAGIIEPGHFRFQCLGEIVQHLEIVLGYQHRTAEPMLAGRGAERRAMIAETIAGDASVGHATACALAVEALTGRSPSPRAQHIRGVALELERLANHTGDLGAMGMDIGFLPTSAFLGRIRGEYLNLTCEICGNRFGRGIVRPGGTRWDIDAELAGRLREKLSGLRDETLRVLDLLFSQPSVLARFEGIGALSGSMADDLGLVGPVARACGRDRDVRRDHPHGVYRFAHLPVALERGGDVYSRAAVRWLEVQRSLEFLLEGLGRIPDGATLTTAGESRPNAMAVGLVETWRGEATYVAFTDAAGEIDFVKAKDPSMHNWFGLAQALRGMEISDFPLCNKSFNLSYCGHDL